VYHLELPLGSVVLVVLDDEGYEAMLYKQVPKPAVRRIPVPDTEYFGASRWLAAKDIHQQQEPLTEAVELALITLYSLCTEACI
jgi:hypothetical protein